MLGHGLMVAWAMPETETDVHLIQEPEDALHVAHELCLCAPRLIGWTRAAGRLFEHQALELLH